jgi:hypothetical protein
MRGLSKKIFPHRPGLHIKLYSVARNPIAFEEDIPTLPPD